MKKSNKDEVLVVSFAKDQIINSKRYKEKRDILLTILDDSKRYTLDEVDNLLNEFNKQSFGNLPLEAVTEFFM